ncbi:MAG: Hsp20/alpha crystallin family protein [Nitrososphaerota archaeon]|nr:Hsp20/alpha crystallin family protein [Nitrososphaerota archaeon]
MSDERRRNLRDALDELDRYFNELEKEIQDFVREGVSSTRVFSKPFMAGFQMKVGPEGRPTIQFFGDKPVSGDGYRVPLTEQTVDKSGKLRLVMDMPGVEKKGIEISATEQSAVVKAEGENRKYKAEVGLKAQVEPDSGKAEYTNGILEISFSLKDKANKGYRRVSVD